MFGLMQLGVKTSTVMHPIARGVFVKPSSSVLDLPVYMYAPCWTWHFRVKLFMISLPLSINSNNKTNLWDGGSVGSPMEISLSYFFHSHILSV